MGEGWGRGVAGCLTLLHSLHKTTGFPGPASTHLAPFDLVYSMTAVESLVLVCGRRRRLRVSRFNLTVNLV